MNETLYYAFSAEIIFSFLLLTLIITTVNWVHSNNFLLLQTAVTIQCLGILLVVLLISSTSITEVSTDLLVQDDGCRKLKNFVLCASLPLVLVVGQAAKSQKLNFPEFMCLFLFSILSLMLLISANNFLVVYLILELQSVTFYAMAGFDRSSSHSTDASLKYFVFGAAFSCLLVLGASVVYFSTGTLNLDEISKIFMFSDKSVTDDYVTLRMAYYGSLGVLFVLMFKLGIVPFHSWAPDVYEGAPLGATIAITVIPKISLLFFACKWMNAFSSVMDVNRGMLTCFAIATIVLSTALALQQKRMKRLLIYSSVSQTGFLFLALTTNSSEGFISIYLFLFAYVIGSSLIWSFLANYYTLQENTFLFQNVQKLRSLYFSDLSNLINKNSIECLILVGVIFSIAGMPPSFGFLTKYSILFSIVQQEFFLISSMVVVASSFAYFYYLRVIKILVFEIQVARMIDKKLQPMFMDELTDAYHVFMVAGVFLLYSFTYLEPLTLFASLVYLTGYLF